jgi:hypothetical protein
VPVRELTPLSRSIPAKWTAVGPDLDLNFARQGDNVPPEGFAVDVVEIRWVCSKSCIFQLDAIKTTLTRIFRREIFKV